MGLRLRLTYASRADLRAHLKEHADQGALYVPLSDIPDGVRQYEPVTLDVEAEDTHCSIQAEVLHVLAGNGIALQLTDLGDAALLAASVSDADAPRVVTVEVAALARQPPAHPIDLGPELDSELARTPEPVETSASEPVDEAAEEEELEDQDEEEEDAEGEEAPSARRSAPAGVPRGSSPVSWPIEQLLARWDELNQAEKVRVARHGTRPARMFVLRNVDKSLHVHVLNNPKVSMDEVASMAAMTNLDPSVLRRIATSSDWQRNATIAKALVCNPKVPLPLITRLIPRVPRDDLARLTRTGKVRSSVKEAIVKYLDRYR